MECTSAKLFGNYEVRESPQVDKLVLELQQS